VNEELAKANATLRRMMARREAERRAARLRPKGTLLPAQSPNRYIAEHALVREEIPGSAGAEMWITYGGMRETWLKMMGKGVLINLPETRKMCDPDALNGYVAFSKRYAPRVPQNSTGNIVQYIPVHGGVTWARKDSYMAVWGFDTMHANSENQPRTDRDWIRANCWVLYRGLLLAEQLWPEFRRASQPRRADLVDQLLDCGCDTLRLMRTTDSTCAHDNYCLCSTRIHLGALGVQDDIVTPSQSSAPFSRLHASIAISQKGLPESHAQMPIISALVYPDALSSIPI